MKLLSVLILTVGLLFGTIYSVHAESLTKEQAEKLADRIMENTPEYVHFEPGSKFKWIVLEDTRDNPAILNEAVLDRAKRKYQVFSTRKDIAEEYNLYRDGKLVGYRRGCIFNYKITFDSADTITVNFSDFEAELAASDHWKKYKWNGKEWIMIEKSIVTCA